MAAFQVAFILFVLPLYTTQAQQNWATITIQNVSDLWAIDDALQVPSTIPNLSISPAVGYFEEDIYLFDSTTNTSFSAKVDSTLHTWTHTPLDKNGRCTTSSCFAQIDKEFFIIYDDTDLIIRYDLDHSTLAELPFTFNYPSYYCVVSDDQYLYAIGDQVNIIIIDKDEPDDPPIFSSAYLPNHISQTEPFACAMDPSQNTIYIFTNFAVFEYSIWNDTLSTLYSVHMNDVLPYNNQSYFTAATGPNDLIWVQNTEYIYPFSSSTNQFLKCRASTGYQVEVSLLSIGEYLLRFGGVIGYNYPECIDNSCEYIRTVTMIDATFHDTNRFRVNDWYHPSYPIGFAYSDAFIAAVGGGTTISLSSSDFNSLIHSDLSFQLQGDTLIVTCDLETCEEGLSIDLELDIAQYVADMNANDADIRDVAYSIEATTFGVGASTSDAFVCNSFPIYPVYLSIQVQLLSAEYFYLRFDYEYLCNGCNVTSFDNATYAFESQIIIKSAVLGIHGEITMKISNAESKCEIVDSDSITYACDNYTLYELDEVFFDGEYTMSVASRDTFLESSAIELELSAEDTRCRMGTGYNEEMNACELCEVNTFSFRSDLRECESCAGLEGVSCDGSDAITVEYRYWLTAYRQSTETYITLFDMHNGSESEDDDVLISHICGYGQCCEDRAGCDYVESLHDGTLCATHRDITSPMCTACEADDTSAYYELLSSNACGVCDSSDGLWHLIWIFVIAAIFTLYLAFVDAQPVQQILHNWRHRNDEEDGSDIEYADLTAGRRRKSTDDGKESEESDDDYESESDVYDGNDVYKKEKPKKRQNYKQKRQREKGAAEKKFKFFVADSYIAYSVLLLQIFPYYFQGYAEILQSEGSRAYLAPIINAFNFNFVNNKVGQSEGFCFVPKQSSLDEIAMILLFPGLMWLSLLLLYMFCKGGNCCISIQMKCCNLKSPICQKPYISIAFIRISMLVLGLVFRVLLQLVTCVQFTADTDSVQFYHSGACHQASWFLGFASMVIFLMYIASVYKKLASQSDDERFSSTNTYSKLVQAYKFQYWYWEAIVTLRRFLLTMFMSLSFLGGGYSNLIFCVVLLMFLFAQIVLNPFAHKRNNRVETFCLLSLLIGVIALNFDDIASSVFVSFFLAVVIFVPVIIAVLFLVQLCRRGAKYFNGDEQYYIDNLAQEDNDNKGQRGGHATQVSAEHTTEKMMTRVLKKVPTEYFEKRKGSALGRTPPKSHPINVLETKPHQYAGDGYRGNTNTGTEMATLSAPHDSDSSCGLSEN